MKPPANKMGASGLIVPIDFTKLREYDRKLHTGVVSFLQVEGHLGVDVEHGVHDVDLMVFPKPATRLRLSEFYREVMAPRDETPAIIKDAMDIRKNAERKRVERAARDEEEGLRRLQQYAKEQELAEVPENAQAVQEWIDQNLKGYWSVAGVDLAIQNLGPRGTNVLRWKPKQAASPAPPAQPSEQLEPRQLPMNASESQIRRADVRAVKDLRDRLRKVEQRDRQGWRGAKF